MDKYDYTPAEGMSRTKRNQDIYNSTDISDISRLKTNNNVSVISDAGKEIDLDKIRSYLSNEYEEDKTREKRISLELPSEEKEEVVRHTIKDYDINSVLERARGSRENTYEDNKYRKIDNSRTEIDILKNIKMREEKEEKDDDITGPIEELNTEEKTIVDLIKDIQSNSSKKKDLFEDLMASGDDTIVAGMKDDEDELKEALLDITRDLNDTIIPDTEFTREMNAEKEKVLKKLEEDEEDEEDDEEESKDLDKLKDLDELEESIKLDLMNSDDDEEKEESTSPKISTIDKSFYTNSMTFNKSDFEGFEDLEKSASSSWFSKVAIVLIIIMLIATILLILNFVFDWNLI